MYYARIKGTERYLTYNGAFWGYSQYYYANEYKTIASAQRAAKNRSSRLSVGKEFEIVDANTLEAIA